MSFGDHLDELRACLIRALIGAMLGAAIALFFGKDILEIIFRPLQIVQFANGLQPSLQVLAPTGAFLAYLKISLISGLIIAMPWVLYQIWRFVASGLYPRERRFAKLLGPASTALFVIGVLFLYYAVLPIVLHFFIRFNKSFDLPSLQPSAIQNLLLAKDSDSEVVNPFLDDDNTLRIPIGERKLEDTRTGEAWIDPATRRLLFKTEKGVLSVALTPEATPSTMQSQFALDFYISFVLMLALAFGIAFETPIVVLFLAWTGIVPRSTMVRSRRYVLLGMLVLCALLTPPDVFSQLLLVVPMYLLYELGMLVAHFVERRADNSAKD